MATKASRMARGRFTEQRTVTEGWRLGVAVHDLRKHWNLLTTEGLAGNE